MTTLDKTYEKTSKPTIGHKYHLAWANAGCVWILEQLEPDGVYCILKTPRTRKRFKAKVEDLRLLLPTAYNYKPF